VYKDANHKPEMAIALTDFEALCGFVAHEDLVEALAGAPELAACVGRERVAALRTAGGGGDARRAALREAFTALMLCDAGEVRAARCAQGRAGRPPAQLDTLRRRAACTQSAGLPGHARDGGHGTSTRWRTRHFNACAARQPSTCLPGDCAGRTATRRHAGGRPHAARGAAGALARGAPPAHARAGAAAPRRAPAASCPRRA